ncbi:MAG: hypothetical protein M0P12_03130 [Paludibacteraceae bacterium]|nr:hypothetical protein [Paludibacteraceae bacterium]MCK9615923.1 hypothetical protein [Candidatus Omnitrophota bacterium]
MKILTNKTIEIEVSDLAEAMELTEMLDLICVVAERLGKETYRSRRDFSAEFSSHLSENAKHLLAEILAAEYTKTILNKELTKTVMEETL